MSGIEHAVPAYVPAAHGRITHEVRFEYPCRPEETPVTEVVPCRGLTEALPVKRTNERLRMRNVRIVERVLS